MALRGYQCYATADLGLIAYETAAREGLVLDEGVIVEIVRPGTGDPVPEGEVGELVITTLNPDYPLIRFGTGDLSAVLPGHCPDGPHQYAHQRLDGSRQTKPPRCAACSCSLGRWPKWPSAFPKSQRARLVVTGAMANDQMTLQVETLETAPGLAQLLQDAMREVTKLRGEVQMSPPGRLPNDGKVMKTPQLRLRTCSRSPHGCRGGLGAVCGVCKSSP